MASKRSRLFYVAGHTCFSMVSRRSPAMRHCRLSHQGGWLICPQLSCFTLEITASPVNKKDYIALEKLDQNLVFLCLSSPFFSPAPQICVSHINFAQNGKTHVVGSKAKSRYWRVKEREEQAKGSLFLLQRAKTIALKGQECFSSFFFSRKEIKAVST